MFVRWFVVLTSEGKTSEGKYSELITYVASSMAVIVPVFERGVRVLIFKCA